MKKEEKGSRYFWNRSQKVSNLVSTLLEKYERFTNSLAASSLSRQYLDIQIGNLNVQPKVSICIPAFKIDYFEEALDSAISQKYSNFEVIVCDDSPGDRIKEVVLKKNDPRIIYHKNQKHLGGRQNYLECIKISTGEYIKFLNDDDVLSDRCLATMVQYFEFLGPMISMVTSDRKLIDENGEILPDRSINRKITDRNVIFKGKETGDYLLSTHRVIMGEPSSVMFRRRDALRIPHGIINLTNKKSYCHVDLIMWLNLLKLGDLAYISEILSFTRIHTNQVRWNRETYLRCASSWLVIIFSFFKEGYLRKIRTLLLAIWFSGLGVSWAFLKLLGFDLLES